jgi:hypothetical protein
MAVPVMLTIHQDQSPRVPNHARETAVTMIQMMDQIMIPTMTAMVTIQMIATAVVMTQMATIVMATIAMVTVVTAQVAIVTVATVTVAIVTVAIATVAIATAAITINKTSHHNRQSGGVT